MTRLLLVVSVLMLAVLPTVADAQVATPASAFGIADAISPADLYERLSTAPFPQDLLPPDVPTLEPYEWSPSSDPDLEGALGGVVFADRDPFSGEWPTAVAIMVFPDSTAPLTPLATAESEGGPTELTVAGRAVPATYARLEEVDVHIAAVDNVLFFGMTPLSADSEELSETLAEAALTHLLSIAEIDKAPTATPTTAASRHHLLT